MIREHVVDGVLFCRRSSGGLFTAEKIADPVLVARYGERTPADTRSQLRAAVVRRDEGICKHPYPIPLQFVIISRSQHFVNR